MLCKLCVGKVHRPSFTRQVVKQGGADFLAIRPQTLHRSGAHHQTGHGFCTSCTEVLPHDTGGGYFRDLRDQYGDGEVCQLVGGPFATAAGA